MAAASDLERKSPTASRAISLLARRSAAGNSSLRLNLKGIVGLEIRRWAAMFHSISGTTPARVPDANSCFNSSPFCNRWQAAANAPPKSQILLIQISRDNHHPSTIEISEISLVVKTFVARWALRDYIASRFLPVI